MTFKSLLAATALTGLLAGCSNGPTDDQKTETDSMTTEQTNAAEKTVMIDDTDPYLWLEEVEGEKALGWVEEMNVKSKGRLESDSRFEGFRERALKVYNAADKIDYGSIEGGLVHNFWQDDRNVRGLWRRSSLDSYKSKSPEWEIMLDLDQLAESEGENWVYKGRDCLAPEFNRCLLRLSRGGADAVVVREFDIKSKSFVEDGFVTPEAKQWTAWVDADTLMIATDFGEGTMNESGYPRQVRLWKRGTPLADAQMILDSDPTLVFNFPTSSHRKDGNYHGIIQGPDFFTQIIHLMHDGQLVTLDLPRDIDLKGFYQDQMIILLRKDWRVEGATLHAGTLVAVAVDAALAGNAATSVDALYTPTDNSSIENVDIGEEKIYVTLLSDVTGTLVAMSRDGDSWSSDDIDMPKNGSLSVTSADEHSNAVLVNFESFTQPDSLYLSNADQSPAVIRQLPERFDASGHLVEQKFATSKDGTRIPYFVIRPKDSPMDGSTPTMLYGYGGFEIALSPGYLTGFSQLWVEEGGAYVVANIRGGGEYGPRWHQAALKENRQRAYDDFIAVAEDLVSTGLTSPEKLGIRGGSNGGLLMGVMTTQRPDLFKAVICAVPLLDMMRYHTMLAGASWVGEYGDPDIAQEREWIRAYSPYQNVKADVSYPEVFFYTSTRDDRVHPGHARKMARKMADMGHPIIYYENTEGGHAAAANLKQRAYTDALQVVYALQKLSD